MPHIDAVGDITIGSAACGSHGLPSIAKVSWSRFTIGRGFQQIAGTTHVQRGMCSSIFARRSAKMPSRTA